MDEVLLWLHIVSGSVGLLTGLINLIRTKGDRSHVRVGRVFFYSMLIAGISALILSLMRPNYFLFVVGTFTLYMVGTGQRYITWRNRNGISAVGAIDWMLSTTMLTAGMVFIYWGVLGLVRSNFFGLVFMTFGLLGLFFVREDFRNYRGGSGIKNFWMVAHLQRMTGTFIAALTAFLVVNAQYFPQFIPGFLYWLLPSLILTPLIIKWSREYGVKES